MDTVPNSPTIKFDDFNRLDFNRMMNVYTSEEQPNRFLPAEAHWIYPRWADKREFSIMAMQRSRQDPSVFYVGSLTPGPRENKRRYIAAWDCVHLTPGQLVGFGIENASQLYEKVEDDPVFIEMMFAENKRFTKPKFSRPMDKFYRTAYQLYKPHFVQKTTMPVVTETAPV